MLLHAATEPIAVNEAHFAVGDMDYEAIEFCKQHNIALVAYSTLSGSVPMSHPTLARIGTSHNVSAAQVMMRSVFSLDPYPI